MMYEYLKKKGMGGMNEHEFMDKFKDFMGKYRRSSICKVENKVVEYLGEY